MLICEFVGGGPYDGLELQAFGGTKLYATPNQHVYIRDDATKEWVADNCHRAKFRHRGQFEPDEIKALALEVYGC